MALLGSIQYDPSSAAQAVTSSATVLTAFDTTNARVTFTAPAAGAGTGTRDVLVRARVGVKGGATAPMVLLGVLESASVIGRQAPLAGRLTNATTSRVVQSVEFVVPNIGSGSHSYDFAYAVQNPIASSHFDWGGPNNTSANDAHGALVMEVWEAKNLLAAANYDPAGAVSKATSSLLAMTAFDTTNLRCTFTAPASGNVLLVGRVTMLGASTFPQVLLGALESSTVVARQAPVGGIPQIGTLASTDWQTQEFSQIVTGVSGGSHSYDFAYGVETLISSTNIKYGGPNDTSGPDAWGMARFEVWSA